MRALVTILLIVASIALIFWAARPLWEDIAELRVELRTINQTFSEFTELEETRDSLLATYNSIPRGNAEKLGQIVPLSPQNGQLLVLLERLSNERGIRLRSVEFRVEEKTQGVAITKDISRTTMLPFSFTLSAQYEAFKSFLVALENSARVVNVTDIAFSVGRTDLFEFVVQAKAYFQKDTEPIEDIRRISSIRLDTSFFSDPNFVALDETPPPSVLGIPQGTINPFLPL